MFRILNISHVMDIIIDIQVKHSALNIIIYVSLVSTVNKQTIDISKSPTQREN